MTITRRTAVVASLFVLVCGAVVAQPLPQSQPLPQPQPTLPIQPMPGQVDDGPEVLARGPVHEAYATSAEQPTSGGLVIEKRPADPIEELPPDQKPEGDNVQWIPGYWHWDEERKDYIWISGFWRNAPPGRVWVPGGWREVPGGWQWVSGFWNVAAVGAKQAEIEYLPPPPASLETGPTVVAPTETSFYTPGSWIYRTNRYVWRPGFWVEHRRDWCWVPDHYRWTPCGYVFVPGFWDVPLARRGVLFAPVYFSPVVIARPRFVYTPVYAVPDTCLYTSLFVRTGHCSYYFGDYFEPRYVNSGFQSWCGASIRGSNFAVNVSVGRGYTYDPLWSYYGQAHRLDPAWRTNVTNVYVGRFNGQVARPPRTLVQQNTIVNNITNVTNVTNNTNVVAGNTVNNNSNNTKVVTPPPAAAPVMLASLTDLKKTNPAVALAPVKAEERTKEQQAAKDLRQVAVERRKLETQLAAKGPALKPEDKPRQVKVDLPQTAVARSQMPADPVKAPPPPAVPVVKKVDPPPAVPTTPAVGTKPTLPTTQQPPKVDPAKPLTPPVMPKIETPKVDPKPTVVPPKPADPKPVAQPKTTDPAKPIVTPPKVEVPRVDPKPVPRVDPPKTDLPKPMSVVQPQKVELPKPTPVVQPPKVELPKPAPVKQQPPPTPAPVVVPKAVSPAPVVTPRPMPVKVNDPPKVVVPQPVQLPKTPVAPPPVNVTPAKPSAKTPTPAPTPGPTGKFTITRPPAEKPKAEKKDEKK
jgi:hypothetical protein